MPALLDILHEDDDLLVVNKPAGLVCHPTRDGEMSSLVGRVRLFLGTTEGRLVNRLDRETSGVVLVAKNATTASELGKILAASGVDKRYWAIVHGHVADATITIDGPLGKDEQSAVAIKDCVRADGAVARTELTVLQRFTHDGAAMTWVDVTPRTGRKHQIRIHLAHIGHPIVGDKIYGSDEQLYLRFIDNALTPEDHATLMVANHLLHARALSFAWKGREWRFEAPAAPTFLSSVGPASCARIASMTREDLVQFATRDWTAIDDDKAAYWADRKHAMSPADALRFGEDLRRHASMARPDWPAATDRAADHAMHGRVSEALRAVTGISTR